MLAGDRNASFLKGLSNSSSIDTNRIKSVLVVIKYHSIQRRKEQTYFKVPSLDPTAPGLEKDDEGAMPEYL